MIKPGDLVRIKDIRKGPNSVSYAPSYIIENGIRVFERYIIDQGLTLHKMKKVPTGSVCLFLKQKKRILCHLLHEEQIIECPMDWIEPLL